MLRITFILDDIRKLLSKVLIHLKTIKELCLLNIYQLHANSLNSFYPRVTLVCKK